MKDEGNRGIFFAGTLIPGLEAAFWAVENQFWHSPSKRLNAAKKLAA